MKLATPRQVYPYRKDGTSAPFRAKGTGAPGFPYANCGNHLTFKWVLDVPVIAAGATANFSPTYASPYPFTFSGTNWLNLGVWRGPIQNDVSGSNHIVLDGAEVYWGDTIHGGANMESAGTIFRVAIFNNALGASSGALFQASDVVPASPSRGGLKLAPTGVPLGILGGGVGVTDRCAFGFQIENTALSPTLAGKLAVLISGHEI